MVRSAPRHDRDAGGPADVLAAKAGLVWADLTDEKIAAIPLLSELARRRTR